MLQAWLGLNVFMAGTLQGGFFPRVPQGNSAHIPLPAGSFPSSGATVSEHPLR